VVLAVTAAMVLAVAMTMTVVPTTHALVLTVSHDSSVVQPLFDGGNRAARFVERS
jgi:hypothetical protein